MTPPIDTSFRSGAALLMDLRNATRDLDLSAREERILEWLASWDPDVVDPILGILQKARHAEG